MKNIKKILLVIVAVCSFACNNHLNAQTASAFPPFLIFPPVTTSTSTVTLPTHLEANFLTPSSGNITISSPSSGFVVSPDGSTYASSFTIGYTGSSVSTTIYVQGYGASSVSITRANVTVTGGGLSSYLIPVWERGAAPCTGSSFTSSVTRTALWHSRCDTMAVIDTTYSATSCGGYTFQWQTSSSGTGGWSSISGATCPSYFLTSVDTNQYYRSVVTCSASSVSANSDSGYVPFYSTCAHINYHISSDSFTRIRLGAYSSMHTIIFNASNLHPSTGAIIFAVPAGFQLYDGSSWVSSISKSYTGGAVSADSFQLRFVGPSFPTTIRGFITSSVGSVATESLPISGTTTIFPCSGTPAPGSVAISPTRALISTTITMRDSAYCSDTTIFFQWQRSPTGVSGWSNITGATNESYSYTGITANTWYKCIVTCSVSGLRDSTDTVRVTYVPPCTGTPVGGTASITSFSCYSCSDTVKVVGCSASLDITYQWEQSDNGTTGWAPITGATNSTFVLVPHGELFLRLAVHCVASGLTGYSTIAHFNYPYRYLSHSVIPDSICFGPGFAVSATGYSSELYNKTYYGDGTFDSGLLSGFYPACDTAFHAYSASGTYTIKNILMNHGVAVDSMTYSYTYTYCRTMPIKVFYDLDSNGVFSGRDFWNFNPFSLFVDSNGVRVDTIAITGGVYYRFSAPPSTIYTFRLNGLHAYDTVTYPLSISLSDTVGASSVTYPEKRFVLQILPRFYYDYFVYGTYRTGIHLASGNLWVGNRSSVYRNDSLKVKFPRISNFANSNFLPVSTSTSYAIWSIDSLSNYNSPRNIVFGAERALLSWSLRDTVTYNVNITPHAGDFDTSDNTEVTIDTAKSGFDPNFIISNPSGYIDAGTTLRYTIGFENTGNDTAHNIHVMDTLSEYLEPTTLRPLFASATMFVEKQVVSGMTIYKYDFPNINLLDSSHHGACDGMLTYTIKVRDGLPDGTIIPARVGIYFDDNEVVMTNTNENIIGRAINYVNEVGAAPEISLIPNPAKDQLTITVRKGSCVAYEMLNSLGNVIGRGVISGNSTVVTIDGLPEGVYFMRLSGKSGVIVKSFVKM